MVKIFAALLANASTYTVNVKLMFILFADGVISMEAGIIAEK